MKSIIITVAFSFIGFITSAQIKVDQMAPEISLPGVKGKTITLSSLKGKVVLIDFWASWCGPCRAAMPGVVKLYQKYKNKGFEIYGVSIDSKKRDWIKAIAKDKITYTQVNDTAGWYSPVTVAYGVDAIPNTFLLDKTGKVVAINLEDAELEAKIKELIK